MNNIYVQTINDQYKKAERMLDFIFSSPALNEDERLAQTEAKVKRNALQLRNALLKCRKMSDIIDIISRLTSMLDKAKATILETDGNDASAVNADADLAQQVKKLLNDNKMLLEKVAQLEKKQADSSKQIKKLKGSIVKKALKCIMKWGIIVMLIYSSAMYVFNKLPAIAQRIAKAEIIAVQDAINIVNDTLKGQTTRINDIAAQQATQYKELSLKLEQNQKVVEAIDGTVKSLSKIVSLFKSQEEMSKDYQKYCDAIEKNKAEWEALNAGKNITPEQIQNLSDRTQENIDKIKEGNTSWEKTKVAFKASGNDIMRRLNSLGDSAKEAAAKAAAEATSAALKTIVKENAANKDNAEKEFLRQDRMLDAIASRFESCASKLNEGENPDADLIAMLKQIWDQCRDNIENPTAAKQWYYDHRSDIIKLMKNNQFSKQSRNLLRNAFAELRQTIDYGENIPGTKPSFFKRNWGKIFILIFILTVFLLGGSLVHGNVVLTQNAVSNVEALASFLSGGWAYAWRALLGILTVAGLWKGIKSLFS